MSAKTLPQAVSAAKSLGVGQGGTTEGKYTMGLASVCVWSYCRVLGMQHVAW
jgi:hypothetical protein